MSQFGLHEYIPKQHAAFIRKQLKEEWNHRCAYCNYQEKHKELTIDHIKPLKKGGDDSYTNLLPACRSCNLSKGHQAIRQWYFDSEHYTSERWDKIKLHMTRINNDVLAA